MTHVYDAAIYHASSSVRIMCLAFRRFVGIHQYIQQYKWLIHDKIIFIIFDAKIRKKYKVHNFVDHKVVNLNYI